jgi:hypothetical protein
MINSSTELVFHVKSWTQVWFSYDASNDTLTLISEIVEIFYARNIQ